MISGKLGDGRDALGLQDDGRGFYWRGIRKRGYGMRKGMMRMMFRRSFIRPVIMYTPLLIWLTVVGVSDNSRGFGWSMAFIIFPLEDAFSWIYPIHKVRIRHCLHPWTTIYCWIKAKRKWDPTARHGRSLKRLVRIRFCEFRSLAHALEENVIHLFSIISEYRTGFQWRCEFSFNVLHIAGSSICLTFNKLLEILLQMLCDLWFCSRIQNPRLIPHTSPDFVHSLWLSLDDNSDKNSNLRQTNPQWTQAEKTLSSKRRKGIIRTPFRWINGPRRCSGPFPLG